MARLLGRRATDTASKQRTTAPLQVLRADGRRIDLSKRDAGAVLTATRSAWQQQAFAYRDLIGELRYAIRLLSRSVAHARFYVAEERPWPMKPTPLGGDEEHDLDPQLAADAVANFELLPLDTNPDGFTARLVENLSITGEAWVHIDAQQRFHVRSVSEVQVANGRIAIAGAPNMPQTQMRPLDPEREDLLRCWIPHPEWAELADSPLRTLLDVCEDVVLAGREQRAAARSRVAANGFLLVPQSATMLKTRQDEDGDEVADDDFMADLTAAMLAPIRDDGDAQAVVPIVLRLDPDDIDKVKHLRVDRDDSSKLIERQQTAILRLLKGLDIQPEQVEGLGASNHWSAWLIEAQSVKHQVQPMAETVAACLAQAFLRPALESLGHDPGEVAKVTIAVDVSPLAENPNRGQDARDAHDRGVISDASLRKELGFDDDDAPSNEEILRRAALSGRLPVDAAAILLGAPRGQQQRPITVQGETVDRAELPAGNSERGGRPVAEEGQVSPNRPVPQQPDITANPEPPSQLSVVAASGPDPYGFRVDVDASRRLADIDAALAERITVAADAALVRVLERAGARVRSQAQKDRALAATLVGVEAHLVPAKVGRGRVEEFVSISDLLADGYNLLRGRFTRWLTDAARQVADVLLDLLRIPRGSSRARQLRELVVKRYETYTEPAWQRLTTILDETAERVMFQPNPLEPEEDPRGESVGSIVPPREVRKVVAAAGGTPVDAEVTPGWSGFGTGPIVRDLAADEGGVLLGWEWQYRPEIVRRHPFPPHVRLNGARFSTWTDPKLDTTPETAWIGSYFRPGDHEGCACTAAPIWAFPELDDGIVAQRLREAAGDPRNLLAAQVAAEDTAAGRVGTSLQMEVEVRDRITEAIERMQREYIERAGS